MGKSTISTGSFSIAMLVYQRVACQSVFVETNKVMIKVMMIEAEIGGVSVIPIVWLVIRYGYNVVFYVYANSDQTWGYSYNCSKHDQLVASDSSSTRHK